MTGAGSVLAEQIGAKVKEAQALLDGMGQKEERAGHEDLQKVRALNEEIKGLRGRLDAAQEADALRGDLAGHSAFMEMPVRPVPFDGGGGYGAGGVQGFSPMGAAALGFTPSGAAQVTEKDDELEVEQTGDGLQLRRAMRAAKSVEYSRSFMKHLRKGFGGLNGPEQKILLEGQDTAGGFVVPSAWLSEVIAKEPTPTRVRGNVRILNTNRDHLTIPKVVYNTDDLYTTGARVTWTGEVPVTAGTASVNVLPFGQVVIPVWTAMISIPLTNDLVEDAGFDLQRWVSDIFEQTIELLYDNMILNGTGIGQPSGILMNPGGANQPAVVTSGNANLLTADGLVNAAMTLPEQYVMNAKWIMNFTSTLKALRQLKDSNNRYLLGAGLQDSGLTPPVIPPNILGFPLVLSGFMPNVAANAYPIVFGDLSSYYLLQRMGFTIQVLREISAKVNQIELLGRIRFGGMVTKDWALKVQQVHS